MPLFAAAVLHDEAVASGELRRHGARPCRSSGHSYRALVSYQIIARPSCLRASRRCGRGLGLSLDGRLGPVASAIDQAFRTLAIIQWPAPQLAGFRVDLPLGRALTMNECVPVDPRPNREPGTAEVGGLFHARYVATPTGSASARDRGSRRARGERERAEADRIDPTRATVPSLVVSEDGWAVVV